MMNNKFFELTRDINVGMMALISKCVSDSTVAAQVDSAMEISDMEIKMAEKLAILKELQKETPSEIVIEAITEAFHNLNHYHKKDNLIVDVTLVAYDYCMAVFYLSGRTHFTERQLRLYAFGNIIDLPAGFNRKIDRTLKAMGLN